MSVFDPNRPSPQWAHTSSSLDLDLYVGTRHAHIVAGDGVNSRWTKDLSGSDVKPCAMERTDHFGAQDLPFGQWPIVVRTGIIQREKLPIDVEQCNLIALGSDQSSIAGCDLVCACHLHEFDHEIMLSSVAPPTPFGPGAAYLCYCGRIPRTCEATRGAPPR